MLAFLWGSAEAALPDVKTVEVNYRELTEEQLFDGVVEAVSRSTVSSQTSGEIVELPYDVNDLVPKGALVLRIDDTRQKAELDKAKESPIGYNQLQAFDELIALALGSEKRMQLLRELAVQYKRGNFNGQKKD